MNTGVCSPFDSKPHHIFNFEGITHWLTHDQHKGLNLLINYKCLWSCQQVLILICSVTSHLYRYRNRRSRTPSASRSPRYRSRRYSRSRSPIRSRSPVEGSRSRLSPRVVRRRSPSRSRSPSKSRSPADSPSPRRTSRDRSRSPSGSPDGKKGLVSYGDGSPDSERWKRYWNEDVPALSLLLERKRKKNLYYDFVETIQNGFLAFVLNPA